MVPPGHINWDNTDTLAERDVAGNILAVCTSLARHTADDGRLVGIALAVTRRAKGRVGISGVVDGRHRWRVKRLCWNKPAQGSQWSLRASQRMPCDHSLRSHPMERAA